MAGGRLGRLSTSISRKTRRLFNVPHVGLLEGHPAMTGRVTRPRLPYVGGWTRSRVRVHRPHGVGVLRGGPRLIVIAALLVVSACGQGDGPAGGAGQAGSQPLAPPIVTEIRIAPEQPRAASPISALVRTSDPMGQRVDVEYQWLHNGVPVPGASAQALGVPQLKRGDEIAVRVTPMARGLRGAAVTSPAVTILNSPPVIMRLTLVPTEVRREDTLRVEAEARDPDGDRVLFTYQWLRNGEAIPGATAPALALKDFRKGDRITVRVAASDLEAHTDPRESPAAVILNSPPRILSGTRWQTGSDGVITYQLAAEDPDGDALTFTLSPDAPRGMTIGANTGIIRFVPGPGGAGTHRFSVTVNDGDGGAMRQEVVLVLREQ